MNNDITEDYCSFEVSKLLKEKNFNIYCQSWYTDDGEFHYNQDPEQTLGWNNRRLPKSEYSRPTHALAIKWIRENFGIHISFHPPSHKMESWEYSIQTKIPSYFKSLNQHYKSPEEATEAALLYTLKNLIK